jgi:hypothetical protein
MKNRMEQDTKNRKSNPADERKTEHAQDNAKESPDDTYTGRNTYSPYKRDQLERREQDELAEREDVSGVSNQRSEVNFCCLLRRDP